MAGVNINYLVQVDGSVVSDTSSTDLPNGLGLTENSLIPFDTSGNLVQSFVSAQEVANYFGINSDEYTYAQNYFNSFSNTLYYPNLLYFALYVNEILAPYTNSGAFTTSTPSSTITSITAGSLTVNFDSTAVTISSLDFSSDTTWSAVASTLQTALQASSLGSSATCTVVSVVGYSGTNYFLQISNGIDTGTSTVTYCSTSSTATALQLTLATGATLSQGSPALTPAENMDNIIAITTNWMGYTTIFDPNDAGEDENQYTIEMGLVAWSQSQSQSDSTNKYFVYYWWSTSSSLYDTTLTPTSGIIYTLQQNGYATQTEGGDYNGIIVEWAYSAPFLLMGASTTAGATANTFAAMGIMASTNYTIVDGTLQLANKTQTDLTDYVTSNDIYIGYIQNNVNCYVSFKSDTTTYNMFMTGACGTDFNFVDNLYNQNWLANALKENIAEFFLSSNKVPNNSTGDSLLQTSMNAVAVTALQNGVIQTGNAFSDAETASIIAIMGSDITSILNSVGYYILITPATSSQRATRTPPGVKFMYTNGSSFFCVTINTIFAE